MIYDSVKLFTMEEVGSVFNELVSQLEGYLEEGVITNKHYCLALEFLENALNAYIDDCLPNIFPGNDIRREINCATVIDELENFDEQQLELLFEVFKADDREGKLRYIFTFM